MSLHRAIITTALVSFYMGSPLLADIEGERILLKEGFDQDIEDGLAKRLLAEPHITLSEGAGPDGSNAIRVAYVGYARGSERVIKRQVLASKTDEATLAFDVKFDENFQWVLGGKLHGLGPKSPITGGEKRRPDGWSARIMFKEGGRCSTYLYDQDMTEKWGVGLTTKHPVFKAGQWYHVVLQVRLNDPGVANGSARIVIDKKEVMKTEKVVFRGIGGKETLIQEFLFSTFHGGHELKYAPVGEDGEPTTVYAWFDNFVVTEGILPD